jgi:uncharacterized protein
MKFAEDHNNAHYKIDGYESTGININGRLFDQPLVLSPMEFIEHWTPQNMSELNPEHLDEIFAMKPEVILLGTGEKQIFPRNEIMRRFAQEKIGYEIMTTQAACRTFNILMSEDRNVVAGFFM